MKNRIISSLLSLGVLSIMGLFLRPLLDPVAAQTSAPAAVGRYQLSFGTTGTVYFLDTATGRLWFHTPGWVDTKDGVISTVPGHWIEMDSPVSKAKPEKP